MAKVSKKSVSGGKAERSALRPDIQGLRALAVIAVILDHSIKWPSGGFVGVDVFFVISGFLITGLLLREHDQTGTLSFSGFYRRRIKRILPAAVTVLAVTVIGSFLVFTSARALAVAADAVWGLFFAANWHFAAIGTDYFQLGTAISPLQHVWSLAVEEQFYLVWPWLMLLIFLIGGLAKNWNNRSARIAVGIAIGVIAVASFIWALWESKNDPTWAYFSTFSRAWELALGAFLAVIAGRLSTIPSRVRTVMGWVGLAGIVASILTITSASTFPAPWALAPVLATVLVIAAGTGAEQKYLWPLTNPVAGFIGEVSYSLYLWHFPVIILIGALLPPKFLWLAFVLTALLSVGTYYLIEDPIRRSNWLTKRKLVPAGGSVKHRPIGLANQFTSPIFGGLIVLLALCVLLVSVSVQKATPSNAAVSNIIAAPTPAASATPAVDPTPALTANTALLQSALGATTWPELSPSIDQLGPSGYVSEWSKDSCLNVSAQNLGKCVYGPASAPDLAVLIGDSEAISYAPAIRAALGSSWRVQILTMEQCPVASVSVNLYGANGVSGTTGAPYPECDAHRKWSFAWIASAHPNLIFMTDATSSVPRIASASALDQQLTAYQAGTAQSIDILSPLASKVVLLTSPPPTLALQACKTALSTPSDCAYSINDNWISETAAEEQGVQNAASHANVTVIDTRLWFCISGMCPAFVGTTPQYTDGIHLTQAASQRLAPLLVEAMGSDAR